jgi:hypothetical protein
MLIKAKTVLQQGFAVVRSNDYQTEKAAVSFVIRCATLPIAVFIVFDQRSFT